jgi:hypothetical protein
MLSLKCELKSFEKNLFDSKKVKDLLPKKMGRFLPTRGLSKIL